MGTWFWLNIPKTGPEPVFALPAPALAHETGSPAYVH
jgi:hypothetical protein